MEDTHFCPPYENNDGQIGLDRITGVCAKDGQTWGTKAVAVMENSGNIDCEDYGIY